MSTRDRQPTDPEEAALIEESKRLIAEMDELIRRAKLLQLEHRQIVRQVREKRVKTL